MLRYSGETEQWLTGTPLLGQRRISPSGSVMGSFCFTLVSFDFPSAVPRIKKHVKGCHRWCFRVRSWFDPSFGCPCFPSWKDNLDFWTKRNCPPTLSWQRQAVDTLWGMHQLLITLMSLPSVSVTWCLFFRNHLPMDSLRPCLWGFSWWHFTC